MSTPYVSQPVGQGSMSHGFAYKRVLVMSIDQGNLLALCQDEFGKSMQVRCDVMRAKGNVPVGGEWWLIDRTYGDWTFAAILNGGAGGVVVPQANVPGLPQALTSQTAATAAVVASTTGKVSTKGDMLLGVQSGVVQRQPVGVNGSVPVADSSSITGISYQTPIAVASALPGATASGRYVGTTVSGPPVSGTFQTGDFINTQSGYLWLCTAGGTPGTWICKINDTEQKLAGVATHANHQFLQTGASWGTGDVAIAGFSTSVNGGIATITGAANIFLNRAGLWFLKFQTRTDSTVTGSMTSYIFWPSGAIFGAWPENTGARASGFAGAGTMRQTAIWTGMVNAAQALQPITCHINWTPSAAGVGLVAAANDFIFDVNFLGD